MNSLVVELTRFAKYSKQLHSILRDTDLLFQDIAAAGITEEGVAIFFIKFITLVMIIIL